MTQEEVKEISDRLEKFTKETTATKEIARQTLIDAGFVKQNGEATALYRN